MKRANKIRLTESQLHRVIKESVKKIVKEIAYREVPIRNSEGEVIDTGGWYDPDDYYDPNEEWTEWAENQGRAERISTRIKNGDYDDKLDSLDSEYFGLNYNNGGDWVDDTIHSRRCLIDKNYAMKYGEEPGTYNKYTVASEKDSPKDKNININHYKWNDNRALSDEYWKEHDAQRFHKAFPSIIKKNGELRKWKDENDLQNRIWKDIIGTDQFDKRPLHRKGSLNREL